MISPLTWLPAALFAQAAAPPAAPTAPPRALFLIGGEYHEYEGNSELLTLSLQHDLPGMQIDRIRIDRPPEGRPAAEKAKTQNRQELLADPKLREKYDLILSYTQESYTDLKPDERDGLLHFVRSGGGFVGMHCASDSFKSDADYVAMVGGRFLGHPAFQKLKIERTAGDHPVLEGIEDFEVEDEFYVLGDCRLDDKSVLLTGRNPMDGKQRPVAWTKSYGAGRVFYTVLGHGRPTYVNESFRRLMKNAVQWVTERDPARGLDGSWRLFNGKDLTGWTMTGPGKYHVDQGELVPEGGMGLLWWSRRPFRDFVLELDWKADAPDDNSGVYVRFPAPWNPWSAVNEGYEIQIYDAGGEKSGTGSVYSFAGATAKASRPAGEWNHYRITVRGQQYTVELNGTKVCEYAGSRAREGYVGIQNHDKDAMVRFKDIRVTELSE